MKRQSHSGAAFQFHPDLLHATSTGEDQLSGKIDFWSSLPSHP